MRRWVTLAVVVALAGGASWLVYKRFAMMGAAGNPMAMMGGGGAPPVGVAPAEGREVQIWQEFSGRITAVDISEIRPRVSGTIEKIFFDNGAYVKKGDPLFNIDQRPFIAEFDRANGALAAAQAQVTLAQRDLTRAEQLYKTKAISQQDYDQRKNEIEVAAATVVSAEAGVETAKLNLDYSLVKAPISGRAGRAEITEGNLVQAGTSLLTTIVADDPVYADFELNEKAYLAYAKSAGEEDAKEIPVELALAGETGFPHKGFIQSFDNHFDTASGTIRVRAILDNKDGSLVPGLFAHVRVGSPQKVDAVLITDRAIGTDQDKKFVYVVGEGNKVAYQEVTLGDTAEGLRIITSGLKAGDKIVVSGLQRARPGAEITPQAATMDKPDVPPPAPPGGAPGAAAEAPAAGEADKESAGDKQ